MEYYISQNILTNYFLVRKEQRLTLFPVETSESSNERHPDGADDSACYMMDRML